MMLGALPPRRLLDQAAGVDLGALEPALRSRSMASASSVRHVLARHQRRRR